MLRRMGLAEEEAKDLTSMELANLLVTRVRAAEKSSQKGKQLWSRSYWNFEEDEIVYWSSSKQVRNYYRVVKSILVLQQEVQKRITIGIFGQTNNGKTTVCEQMFNLKLGSSVAKRTAEVQPIAQRKFGETTVTFLDTPGLNDLVNSHSEAAQAIFGLTQVFIYVAKCALPSKTNAADLRKCTSSHLLIVLTHADQCVEESPAEIANIQHEWAKLRNLDSSKVVLVSLATNHLLKAVHQRAVEHLGAKNGIGLLNWINDYLSSQELVNSNRSLMRPRFAICFGNTYEGSSSPLPCCQADAEGMATRLAQFNFQASVQINKNFKEMNEIINEISNAVADEEADILIYFSGHGAQQAGRQQIQAADHQLIAVDTWIDLLNQRGAARNFLILDCCRSDADQQKSISGHDQTLAGRHWIFYSSDPSKVSFGGHPHSKFTAAVLQCIGGGRTLQEFGSAVQKLLEESGSDDSRQRCWIDYTPDPTFCDWRF